MQSTKTHICWSVYKLVKSLWERAFPSDAAGLPVGVYQRGALTHEHQYKSTQSTIVCNSKTVEGATKTIPIIMTITENLDTTKSVSTVE